MQRGQPTAPLQAVGAIMNEPVIQSRRRTASHKQAGPCVMDIQVSGYPSTLDLNAYAIECIIIPNFHIHDGGARGATTAKPPITTSRTSAIYDCAASPSPYKDLVVGSGS